MGEGGKRSRGMTQKKETKRNNSNQIKSNQIKSNQIKSKQIKQNRIEQNKTNTIEGKIKSSIVLVINIRQIFFAGECFVFLTEVSKLQLFESLPKTRNTPRKKNLSYIYDHNNTAFYSAFYSIYFVLFYSV